MKTLAILSATAALAPMLVGAAPSVGNVTLAASGHTVNVTYDLSENAIVTLDILTNGVSVGYDKIRHLSGDVNRPVTAGTGKSIAWTPWKDWPDGGEIDCRAEVTAWAYDAPPPVCAVSLESPGSVLFYPSLDALPGGVTNRLYKKQYLLMKKIPAAGVTWRMGTPAPTGSMPTVTNEYPHLVTLSQDYYMGVYEFTRAQWRYYNTWIGNDTMPAEGTDDEIKPAGSLTFNWVWGHSTAGYNWPAEREPGNVIAFLRGRCRNALALSLPTEAQWEYAARAGKGHLYADGSDSYSTSSEYYWDQDSTLYSNERHVVGTTTRPNAYGLYDMSGNVMELCLDVYRERILEDEVDPVGPAAEAASALKRVIRGGGLGEGLDWGSTPYQRSVKLAHRKPLEADNGGNNTGFRVCAPAVYVPPAE